MSECEECEYDGECAPATPAPTPHPQLMPCVLTGKNQHVEVSITAPTATLAKYFFDYVLASMMAEKACGKNKQESYIE